MENKLDKWIKNKLDHPKSLLWNLVAFIGLFFVFLPWLLVNDWELFGSWGQKFDDQTGVIGDTIGGIVSPFVALLGVVLTFFAFYIQYKANQRQNEIIKDQKEKEGENEVEKRFFFLIEHYFRLENQLDYNEFKAKSTFGVFMPEIKFMINMVQECVIINYGLDSQFHLLNNRYRYIIIKIAIELWYDGFDKNIDEYKLLEDILISFNRETNIGNPLDEKYLLHNAKINNFGSFTQYKDFIGMTKFDTSKQIKGVKISKLYVGHSSQLSAYLKSIYNILIYVNNSILLSYTKKAEWIKFFIELMSDEELEFLAYISLSKVLYGLEIGPKENVLALDSMENENNDRILFWINKMIVSKYKIFDTYFDRLGIRNDGLQEIYFDHLKTENIRSSFNYADYEREWNNIES